MGMRMRRGTPTHFLADPPLCHQVGSGRVDALGVLEPVFQLLWSGRLSAQTPLRPVNREPLPSPPPHTPRGALCLPTHASCPLILGSLLECGCGWCGRRVAWRGEWGERGS